MDQLAHEHNNKDKTNRDKHGNSTISDAHKKYELPTSQIKGDYIIYPAGANFKGKHNQKNSKKDLHWNANHNMKSKI